MKIQQPKKPGTRSKGHFCPHLSLLFEKANILSKSLASEIGSKTKKKPTFMDKHGPKLVQNSHFWDRDGTINFHITYPLLKV